MYQCQSLKSSAVPFPTGEDPPEEGIVPSQVSWSFQSRLGLKEWLLRPLSLTSCPTRTVKGLHEAACNLLRGRFGQWCLFLQILQDPHFTFLLCLADG